MRSASLLALTGGGIMARFTTQVLEDLQARRERILGPKSLSAPIRHAFDLMAGTSAGALCVAGLLAGRSPADLSQLFDKCGPRIFPRAGFWRKARWVLTAKYDARPLHAAVDMALDGWNPRLGELEQVVAFPAVDESAGLPVVFTNADPAWHEVPLRDAVLASAAAPTYFPAHRIEVLDRRYVDGGLFANAPDLAALTIARSLWPTIEMNDLHLVSVGTTSSSGQSPFAAGHPGAMGLLSWTFMPPARLLKLAMRSQVDHAIALLDELKLADFIRIDATVESSPGVPLELDNASAQARALLAAAGAGAVGALSERKRRRLHMLTGRQRALWTPPRPSALQ